MLFENLIGNEKNKSILSNITEPMHAYMFIGKNGIGKFLFAKEFANKFLCTNTDKPCNKCKSCLQFQNNNNMDFQVIDVIDKSIKVEQIREFISGMYEKPILADKKFYIINNADKMTVQAQNALLKILEEPPRYVIIVLVVENENAILNTIKSRCLKMFFDSIEEQQLRNYLESKEINTSEEMMNVYCGSIGKAISLIGKEESYIRIKEILDNMENIPLTQVIKRGKFIYEAKDEVENLLEHINILLYEKLSKDIKYISCIEKVNKTIENLRYNSNTEMLIDDLLITIWEELNEKHSRS